MLHCSRQAGSSVVGHLLGIRDPLNTLIPNTHQLWTCWKWGTRCEKAGGSSGGSSGGSGGGAMAARVAAGGLSSAAAASSSASHEVTPKALQACPSGLLPPAAIPALGTLAGLREHDRRHTRIAERRTGSHKAPFGRSMLSWRQHGGWSSVYVRIARTPPRTALAFGRDRPSTTQRLKPPRAAALLGALLRRRRLEATYRPLHSLCAKRECAKQWPPCRPSSPAMPLPLSSCAPC